MAHPSTPSFDTNHRRKRGRKPSLTLERIANVALTVGDADGLDAITIKRISRELGVATMTVYGYVRSKEEILAAMTDVAVREIRVPVDGPWQDRLRAFFSSMHEMQRRHPVVALLNARQPLAVGHNTLHAIDQVLAIVLESGLSGAAAVLAFRSLASYTLGSSLFYIVRTGDLANHALLQRDHAMHAIDPSQYPHIAALAPQLSSEGASDHFARGLSDLIDGISAEATASKRRNRSR